MPRQCLVCASPITTRRLIEQQGRAGVPAYKIAETFPTVGSTSAIFRHLVNHSNRARFMSTEITDDTDVSDVVSGLVRLRQGLEAHHADALASGVNPAIVRSADQLHKVSMSLLHELGIDDDTVGDRLSTLTRLQRAVGRAGRARVGWVTEFADASRNRDPDLATELDSVAEAIYQEKERETA